MEMRKENEKEVIFLVVAKKAILWAKLYAKSFTGVEHPFSQSTVPLTSEQTMGSYWEELSYCFSQVAVQAEKKCTLTNNLSTQETTRRFEHVWFLQLGLSKL